ncbi:MAG: TSUP family transporter [Zoogloeaceae bacterium]|nr:TSUP family transporter [Zoogloeaceae bacterium]
MVDAVVGGGGLIQIPALFSVFPTEQPARLFGTNKVASIVGTSSAAWHYARRITMPWGFAGPGVVFALAGSALGATFVSALDPTLVRSGVIALLLAVAGYTYCKKDFGLVSDTGNDRPSRPWVPWAIAGGVGCYDGFFGPGTGSFFIFLLIRCVGLDFLRASTVAKLWNAATNLAAIGVFAGAGAVKWELGVLMALCNLVGAQLGARLALRRGAKFVRHVFLAVVLVLVLKLTVDLVVA